jgi:hypothetical protein
MTKKTWYVSTAENSKGNYVLATTKGRIVVSRTAVGELDMNNPKSVATLDKFVSTHNGNTITDDNGRLITFVGFETTREYASKESALKAIHQAYAESIDAIEIEYLEADLEE